ncbi:unnamed protein product [Brachionus calyciflorus]|uniref:Carboxylesterase type B domain-containing protein n=1 Tax=Brachionus calyciflorus TaxID=104777 RepID=A0A813M562_9BILA|nr:unnamed protein product [Brachionus calyciflorus]
MSFKKYYLIFINFLTCVCIIWANSLYWKNNLYNTTSGLYEARVVKIKGYGFEKPKYLHKLIGVPYAEKPERFKNPVLRKYEPGIHKPKDSVACYQSVNITSYGLFNINEAAPMKEDCLTVNLYIPIPNNQDEENKLQNMSVVIHIHGGSNMVGAAGLFDGSYLASKGGIIVAIINYRLSILGFLSDLTPKYPGNYGLRDQIMAIEWIKNNCHILKCNPNSITLWGHSAGAGDANWLALSPLSSSLIQRIIINSGSSFSYWGFDKQPLERYKSLKMYFNCSDLPDEATIENGAMTKLIDCLTKIPLEDLFQFKFALIDAPGPVYDGFLGSNSLINKHSLREMMDAADNIENIDILTSINGVEGFSFEGYFSNSVKFFTQNNLTNEVILTLERISLLSRDKCKQNIIIENRLKIEEFYTNKMRKYLINESYLNSEEARRIKSIFATSDAIFDSGFIDFLVHLTNKKNSNQKFRKSNLFVYEYLHENFGGRSNVENYKKVFKNLSMSTHFDGIDSIFGLPISFFNKWYINHGFDYPFSNFSFETNFTREEADLSILMIKIYSNFIKYGDPNKGEIINFKWDSYMKNNSYLKFNSDLLKNKPFNTSYGVRDDLYNFWFVEMDKNGNCSSYDYNENNKYEGKKHTKGKNPTLDNCFELLNQSKEYNYMTDMFLIEYEKCMNSIENVSEFKSLFNTFCLDVIAIKRMLIEYDVCCKSEDTWSTICEMKNFDKKFLSYDLKGLIDFTKKMSRIENDALKLNFFTRNFVIIFLMYSLLII